MDPQESEQLIHLADYLDVLLKHKWLITAVLIVVVTATMLMTFRMQPVYQATAVLVIDKERNTSPLTGEILDFENYSSQMLTFNTHFKLITSIPVLEKVAASIKPNQTNSPLTVSPASPIRDWFRKVKHNIGLIFRDDRPAIPSPDRLTSMAYTLKSKINIQQVRETRLLKIHVNDTDPVMAADIADHLAARYIEFDISNRVSSSRNTLTWLQNQLYDVKKKLEDAEREFQAYKENEKIFSIKGKQNVITQKIEEFNDAFLQTRHNRLELDAKLSKINRQINADGNVVSARTLIRNHIIDNLYQTLLNSELELNRLGKTYRQKHPKIIQMEGKIKKTRTNLENEIRKEVGHMQAERSVLHAKEQALEKTIADFEKDAFETNRKELRYRILQRNVNTNQNLYNTLLSKIKETHVEDNLDISNIRIVEKASVPMSPIKPRKKLNLLLSLVVGLMSGTGLAFLIEYMDRTIRNENDVLKYLELPVLSVIPKADKTLQKQGRSGVASDISRQGGGRT